MSLPLDGWKFRIQGQAGAGRRYAIPAFTLSPELFT